LAGITVGTDAKVRCPFGDHSDRTPSLHAYPHADQGWYCFGCSRGGTIYEFAAALAGLSLPLRGDDFKAVRAVLLETFRGESR